MATNGDLKRWYSLSQNCEPGDFVRVGKDGKLPDSIQMYEIANSVSHITLTDSKSTVVPVLSAGQVITLHDALTKGKIALIHDAFDNVDTMIVERAVLDGKKTISCVYLGRLVLTYTVNGSNSDITFKEL